MGKYEAKSNGHWITNPKTRAYLYGIGIAASPLAVGYGIINAEQSGLWVSFLGAVLGINNSLALANLGNKGADTGANDE